jgi:hypothetical protein
MKAIKRTNRIVYQFPPSKEIKDKIFYTRSRRETLELFDNIIVSFGERVILESLVDNEWIEQEVKTKNKNKPIPKESFEYIPVPNPK